MNLPNSNELRIIRLYEQGLDAEDIIDMIPVNSGISGIAAIQNVIDAYLNDLEDEEFQEEFEAIIDSSREERDNLEMVELEMESFEME